MSRHTPEEIEAAARALADRAGRAWDVMSLRDRSQYEDFARAALEAAAEARPASLSVGDERDGVGDGRAKFDAEDFLASALATAADVEFAQLSDDEKHPWLNHASGLLFEIGMHGVADAMDAGKWPWRDDPALVGDGERIETGWVEIEFRHDRRVYPVVADYDCLPESVIGSRHKFAVRPLAVRSQEGGKA